MKFEEGKHYLFTIKNIIQFQDGLRYFILQGPGKVNYLLDFEAYSDYGFEKGQEINCRIDKINCSGRIFLEPDHPHYKENNTYAFRFLRKQQNLNPWGDQEKLWILEDVFKKEIPLLMADHYYDYEAPDLLECMVTRIRKARLSVDHPWSSRMNQEVRIGNTYKFRIRNLESGINNTGFFSIEDPFGKRHFLEHEYYKRYGFTEGQAIDGKVIKWSEEGRFVIEPEHPFYTKGQFYQFNVSHAENPVDAETGISQVIVAADMFGNEIKVPVYENIVSLSLTPEMRFKVVDIRKGRPVLRLN